MTSLLWYIACFAVGLVCHRAWQNDEALNNLCDCVLYLLLAAKEYVVKKCQALVKMVPTINKQRPVTSSTTVVDVAKNEQPVT